MKIIDRFLNSITMYRLVGYGLLTLAILSIVFGFTGVLSYSGLSLMFSLVVLLVLSNLANFVFSKLFRVTANVESASITALILFFLLLPEISLQGFLTYAAASFLSMFSKYVLRIQKKHVFNPVAITAVILGLAGSGFVVWWVGSFVMAPFVLVLGLLVVQKIRRFHLFFAFVFSALVAMFFALLPSGKNVVDLLQLAVSSWPLVFFGTVMLTEPLTTPPDKQWQIVYGLLVGGLFGSHFVVGPFYSTPELALVLGNIFSYVFGCRKKTVLSLLKKNELAPHIFEFVFQPDSKMSFLPGQYMEWTLGHNKCDSRGIRRYFTIASSPTEKTVALTVKVSDQGSTFKKRLMAMKEGETLCVAGLGGEFTLPENVNEKLVFIAGGIGLTPFRSMFQYLMDRNQKRDITFFYAASSPNEFVYKDFFSEVEKKCGVKVVYVITTAKNAPPDWKGEVGYMNKAMVEKYVSDYSERKFYISGPDSMVQAYKKLLKGMKVRGGNIRTDYFPGF